MRLLRMKGPQGDAAASGPARLIALRGAAAAAAVVRANSTSVSASSATGAGSMDDPGGGGGGRASPAMILERDLNSNAAAAGAGSFVSESASLPDADFVQECQDYQWFLDYGYREGGGPQPGAGLLASLASSAGLPAPAYEDLARDIDANLAEVDMEDFRSEDIHSVLSTLPAMCCGDLQTASAPGGEMYASVTGSLLARLELEASSSDSPRSCGSRADDSAGSTDTMSLCKSELLFSPVKDCPLPSSNFSVDSLDCDLLTEHDIMLTCQANKDNYTIAFEGSVTLYSEDSDYHEPDLDNATAGSGVAAAAAWAASARALRPGGASRDSSMARSDSVYTTWSKLQKRSGDAPAVGRRTVDGRVLAQPVGDDAAEAEDGGPPGGSPVAGALKSQSLPNLSRRRRRCLLASLSGRLRSAAAAAAMTSSAESESRSPATTVKLYDVQQSSSGLSEATSSVDGGACSSCGSGRRGGSVGGQQQHFSLVKLFMKQKSQSSERVGCAMDQSSASECWPASANSASEGDSDSFAQECPGAGAAPAPAPPPSPRHRIAPGAAAAAAAAFNDNALGTQEANGNDGALADSPTDTAASAADVATNNWIRADEATIDATELSASCLEDSLAEAEVRRRLMRPAPRPRLAATRRNGVEEEEDEDEFDEEDEEPSERSESVEQLSESVSKIEESALDLGVSSCGSSGPVSLSETPAPAPTPNLPSRPRLPSANNNSLLYGVSPSTPRRTLQHHHSGTHHHHHHTDNNNGSVEAADEEDNTLQCQATQTSITPAAPVSPSLMNRSVQTSTNASIPSAPPPPPLKVLGPNAAPRIAKMLGSKKPLFVFYPSYALPDLAFLQEKPRVGTEAKVYLVPQTFRTPVPVPGEKLSEKIAEKLGPVPPEKPMAPGVRLGVRRGPGGRRPFSCTDVEALRRKGFAHVQDWESLTVLLPRECRRILAEVPELEAHLKAAGKIDEKPHFCVSPPPPPSSATTTATTHMTGAPSTPKSRRPRPASCGDTPAETGGPLEPKGVPTSSSSSSTATQPSSGYRGSSTMLLTDSSGGVQPVMAPAYNPLFVYRYDSVSSEGSMMSTPAPPPKRSVSLPTGAGKKSAEKIASQTTSPPRPPLPRGILRQSEKIIAPSNPTITAYNCKVHKNQANSKRYSMFELGGCKGSSLLEDDEFSGMYDNDAQMRLGLLGKPRSRAQTLGTVTDAKEAARRLAACLHPEKDIDEAEDEETDEGVDADLGDDVSGGSGCEMPPPTPPLPRQKVTSNGPCSSPAFIPRDTLEDELEAEDEDDDDEGAALSLEELLQVSALSALGPAAAAAAAAASVSDGNTPGWDDTQMQRLRLQVSKFLLGQQPASEDSDCHTPHNTPEHHGCACGPAYKKTVSFAERSAASPIHDTSPSTGAGSFGSIGSPTDSELAHQRGLVMTVAGAVDALVRLFSTTHDPVVAAPAAAELALTKLCPALYAVLGDGLRAKLDTPFGAIPNSVWQVVEASAQQGPMTQALSELVLRINGEDVLSEGAMRFNAFAFALLNARSLDAWLAFVRTRERVLRRHYVAPSASNSGGVSSGLLAAAAAGAPAARQALDRIVAALQPLALLPFRLDPLWEARRLHASLRRLRQLSPQGAQPSFQRSDEEVETCAAPPPPTRDTTGARQWTLRQLVRSIQSSLSVSADEEAAATWIQTPPPPPPPRSPRRRSPETILRQAMAGETVPHHPNCSGPVASSDTAPVAPTSGEPLPDLLVAGSRWPAGTDRTRARPRSCAPSTSTAAPGAGAGFSLVTDIASTVRKRWSGIQLGSKLFQAFDRLAAEDSDEEYTDSLEPRPSLGNVSSTTDAPSSTSPAPTTAPSPSPSVSTQASSSPAVTTGFSPCPSPAPGSNTGGGKFRRLQMKWEMLSGKESGSGTGSAPGSPSPRSPKSPRSPASVTSPEGGAGAGSAVGGRSKIPRPVSSPVRPSAIPTATTATRRAPASSSLAGVAKRAPATPAATNTRASRADRPAAASSANGAARPSSLPYRAPSGGARPAARAAPVARRAASSSQGRTRSDGRTQPAPRFVRTLSHRLPVDSGHLSFNEGERLRVVLEVDSEWLLCCRGDRKGLVPRSAVIGADAA